MLLLAKIIALGFGSGKAPFAPGTFGTLAAIPIFLLMQNLSLLWFAALVLLFFSIGVWACTVYSNYLGVHDHGSIVWDEVVGYLITMIMAPSGWQWVIIGFALFRFFDIIKPWPINWLDKRVHGGFGIMIDDVLAGIYALIVLQVMAYYFT
ncbi:MAG: phosphatidylglycerophosphatase A [Gammaproteobacteria bacterium]|nr:phosphatidylglycerophosphatase A [Gammaproteobacteria bacterium]